MTEFADIAAPIEFCPVEGPKVHAQIVAFVASIAVAVLLEKVQAEIVAVAALIAVPELLEKVQSETVAFAALIAVPKLLEKVVLVARTTPIVDPTSTALLPPDPPLLSMVEESIVTTTFGAFTATAWTLSIVTEYEIGYKFL